MTVAEYILCLQELPQDAIVISSNECGSCNASAPYEVQESEYVRTFYPPSKWRKYVYVGH